MGQPMLDGISLDQLRTFVTAVEEGSFSAAARKLRRVQSVVSHTLSNLEDRIGVALFDRSERYPRLTPQGIALLADARGIIAGIEGFKARAKGMAAGLEAELSVVIDVMFPIEAIASVAQQFRLTYPNTPLRLYVEALGAAFAPVLDGRCGLGVVGPLPIKPASLSREPLHDIELVMVAAHSHPLAAFERMIPREELMKHVQLVLTDRSDLSAGRELGVISPLTWRIADLFAKHAFLLQGLGWGGMPAHTVRMDVAEGRLKVLSIEDVPPQGLPVAMSVVYPTASPPGPAGRWFIRFLQALFATSASTAPVAESATPAAVATTLGVVATTQDAESRVAL
jgi:DNA-binding transcriptional LysR family regulator